MVSVLEEFRIQSRFCGEFESPFTEQLLARCAADIEAGGIVAGGWGIRGLMLSHSGWRGRCMPRR